MSSLSCFTSLMGAKTIEWVLELTIKCHYRTSIRIRQVRLAFPYTFCMRIIKWDKLNVYANEFFVYDSYAP